MLCDFSVKNMRERYRMEPVKGEREDVYNRTDFGDVPSSHIHPSLLRPGGAFSQSSEIRRRPQIYGQGNRNAPGDRMPEEIRTGNQGYQGFHGMVLDGKQYVSPETGAVCTPGGGGPEEMRRLEKTLAMIRYKRWYYEQAMKDGNEDGVRSMLPDHLPEEIQKLYDLANEE